ncbi:SMR family transporter [Ectobacillus sp. JY-23]|uniref:DMT family transporter n=1 Tax=Ectobacillus sp. JY-23 TaxID=2933872 RepID=UPI001FF130CC|nr:SMR family transporter [Ectobacillus sp. JY-23]UOY93976.1 SMR family transporter [Ectobacillus sp. JY-23]
MEWLYVVVAGLIEVIWVLGLKYANSAMAWFGVSIAILISFWLLFKAYKTLPVGTVYAVFTGIGTAGIVIVEAVITGAFSISKIILIAILSFGVIGLKRSEGNMHEKEGA